MSYIRKASVTVIPTTLVAGAGYTTDVNGLLYRVQTATTAGIPSTGIKATVGTEGSTLNRILFFEKVSSGSTTLYPRVNVHAAGSTVLTSSGLDGLIPIAEGRLRVTVNAASSASSTGGITFTFWYG